MYAQGHRGRGHHEVSLTPKKCYIHQTPFQKDKELRRNETQIRLDGERMNRRNGPSTGGFPRLQPSWVL